MKDYEIIEVCINGQTNNAVKSTVYRADAGYLFEELPNGNMVIRGNEATHKTRFGDCDGILVGLGHWDAKFAWKKAEAKPKPKRELE